jgi:limonene-1,2-epoxide hydrolase
MSDSNLDRRALLQASALGVALAAFGASRGAHAQAGTAEAANLAIVEKFCAAWGTRDLKQITSHLADDSVYRMTETTPPIVGHEPFVAQLQPWMVSSDSIEFKILETFAKGPIVVTHRIDRFASKTRPLTWEGVGVFFVQNGKIKEWSDFTIRTERA